MLVTKISYLWNARTFMSRTILTRTTLTSGDLLGINRNQKFGQRSLIVLLIYPNKMHRNI